jgi:hypothetical protein
MNKMIDKYVQEILSAGGNVPDYQDDQIPMQIAKLDDALRKAGK